MAAAYSVVIPSRKDANLERAIDAIRMAGETCRIIAVDDGLEGKPFGAELVAGRKPFIFARNCNLGIGSAYPDDVVLLNDDALLETPGGFGRLSGIARANPDYGVIAAACAYTGNPGEAPRPGGNLREEPRMVCFTCVYIRRAVLRVVGPLDERFAAYGFEDDDYCLRARRAGLRIGVFDGCVVEHLARGSTFARGQDLAPGRALFVEKWGSYPL